MLRGYPNIRNLRSDESCGLSFTFELGNREATWLHIDIKNLAESGKLRDDKVIQIKLSRPLPFGELYNDTINLCFKSSTNFDIRSHLNFLKESFDSQFNQEIFDTF